VKERGHLLRRDLAPEKMSVRKMLFEVGILPWLTKKGAQSTEEETRKPQKVVLGGSGCVFMVSNSKVTQ